MTDFPKALPYHSLVVRYTNWAIREEDNCFDPDTTVGRGETFAIRGDGAMVCFDDEGYFLLVWTGPGEIAGQKVENLIQVKSPYTDKMYPVYCEPTWIAGYYDTIREA